MIWRARVFLFILLLNRAAFPQTPEELAQTAARAMQQQRLRNGGKRLPRISPVVPGCGRSPQQSGCRLLLAE